MGGGTCLKLNLSAFQLSPLNLHRRSWIDVIGANVCSKVPTPAEEGFTLAEGATHVAMPPVFSKAGFTLAEVLITLGIIGVVAAITIPALVTNHRAKVMRTKLLRADAIIQQAAMRAKADEVNLDEVINQKKYEEFEIYFKNGSCKLPKDAREAKYKNYSGSLFTVGASANTLVHSYCLFDGMILWFGKFTAFNDGVFLAIDINGWNVKPDRYGQDVFFWYYNQNTQMLIPTTTGVLSSGQYNFFDKCPGNPTAEQGISCTYKAIHDESYFKKLPK